MRVQGLGFRGYGFRGLGALGLGFGAAGGVLGIGATKLGPDSRGSFLQAYRRKIQEDLERGLLKLL